MVEQIKEVVENIVLFVAGCEAIIKIVKLLIWAKEKLRKLLKGGRHARK